MSRRSASGLSERGRYWRELIREWRRSGQTQRAFCQARGVNHGTFAWWKREIGGREHASTSAPSCAIGTPASPAGGRAGLATFAPVCIRTDDGHEGHAAVEIILADRRRILLRGPVDRAQLADVLSVLEAVGGAAEWESASC